MHTNAQRLLKLINNLLDLTKVEGRRLGVKRRPTQIGKVIEALLAGSLPLAERKGVELERSGLSDLPVVNVDPEALEKIIVNLLGNALKFTPAGGRIELSGSEESGAVHLVVADTGSGSVTIENTSGQLTVDTGSGQVVIRDCRGQKISVDTGSGSVTAESIDCERLVIDTGSGGVVARGVSTDAAKVDTGSGSVELYLDRMGGGRFTVDTGSGSIDFQLPHHASAQIVADTG